MSKQDQGALPITGANESIRVPITDKRLQREMTLTDDPA